jgi:hypothetical protein
MIKSSVKESRLEKEQESLQVPSEEGREGGALEARDMELVKGGKRGFTAAPILPLNN